VAEARVDQNASLASLDQQARQPQLDPTVVVARHEWPPLLGRGIGEDVRRIEPEHAVRYGLDHQ